jgi:hypothetical protein
MLRAFLISILIGILTTGCFVRVAKKVYDKTSEDDSESSPPKSEMQSTPDKKDNQDSSDEEQGSLK